jgi:putative exosortase-associated protein (TIGR04073 family)
MTKITKKGLAAFVLALVVLGSATACFASDPFTKLGRGVANTLTGWVELPKNVYSTSVEDNAFAGMTLGLAKGAGMSIVRTGAGIYEIATFPFPLPEDYKPILEPEYVF